MKLAGGCQKHIDMSRDHKDILLLELLHSPVYTAKHNSRYMVIPLIRSGLEALKICIRVSACMKSLPESGPR